MVQIIILKTDEVLISEIEEVESELGEPDCKLINPVKILCRQDNPDVPPEGRFEKWLSEFTNQTVTMVHSDSILTLVEPHKALIDAYQKFLNT